MSRAAEKGDERVVELLLKYGALPDFEDQNSQTPLSRAIEEGKMAVIQLLLDQNVKTDYKYIMVSESNDTYIGCYWTDG